MIRSACLIASDCVPFDRMFDLMVDRMFDHISHLHTSAHQYTPAHARTHNHTRSHPHARGHLRATQFVIHAVSFYSKGTQPNP